MKFTVKSEEHNLDIEKFNGFLNDEENPIKDIDEKFILNILEGKELEFEKAYYSAPCSSCKSVEQGKSKAYGFFEYHFYLFTKNSEVVSNSFKTEETGVSFTRMEREGKADNSYIVSVIVCAECGSYEIEIEQIEV